MIYTCIYCGKKFQSNESIKKVICVQCLVQSFVESTYDVISRINEYPPSVLKSLVLCTTSVLKALERVRDRKYGQHRE